MNTLRIAFLAAALTLVSCAGERGSGPLRPTDTAQAAQGEPLWGQVDAAGVSIVARVGSWRGWPRDLEQRVTPVALTVVNRTPKTVRIAPETFSLAVGRRRYTPMSQLDVSRAISDLAGFRSRRPPFQPPGTPGFDPFTSPRNVPVPGPGDWQGAFDVSGTLAPGERLQTVLYFDTPAVSLREASLEANVVDDSGAKLADVRLPFARASG